MRISTSAIFLGRSRLLAAGLCFGVIAVSAVACGSSDSAPAESTNNSGGAPATTSLGSGAAGMMVTASTGGGVTSVSSTSSVANTANSSAGSGGSMGTGGAAAAGLHVEGNHLVDNGKVVRLHGVDHSGTEYQCVNGDNAIFEGPSDASLVTPMKAWNINAVRVPLNEDCWLGINGVATAVSGAAYQMALTKFVEMLRSNGMYVIVELHWNAPGTKLANAQQPMPDQDHAPTFWGSVAGAFKSDMGVIFDLYNEPYPDNNQDTTAAWTCWRDGGTCSGVDFPVAGMQSLVKTVRDAGAANVIMLGGVQYANALSQWLKYEPTDALSNLVASTHIYQGQVCSAEACYDATLKPVAAKVPLVTGEVGESDCGESFVDDYFTWADPLGVSYLGWAWNVQSCGGFPALISNYDGTATGFGAGFKKHYPTQ